MSKWILKAIVQKGISFLPFSQKINYFFQKYVTRGVYLSDEYFEDRLIHCREHYKQFRKYSSVKDFSHLETEQVGILSFRLECFCMAPEALPPLT